MKKQIKRKKQIRSYIISITFVFMFLVLATLYVYYPSKLNLLSSVSFLQKNEPVSIEEISEGINLAHAYPVSDQEGINTNGFIFKIKNNSNTAKSFTISFKNQFDKIKDRGLKPLEAKYLRYNIEDTTKEIFKTAQLEENFIIYEGTIPANTEYTFEFKVWLGENFDENALNKTFIGQMEVNTL